MLYIIPIFIVIIDQITKFLAVRYLKGQTAINIIDNFIKFEYVENYGAAFGILQEKKIFFIIVTLIVLIAIIFFVTKYFYALSRLMKIALAMLSGGAVGNFIDRVRLGYVLDFISLKLPGNYKFPVFNIADSFIVISTVLIVALILFDKYES